MFKEQVLDHGFVILRNISGPTRRLEQTFDASDIDPAQAARMSFNELDSDRTESQDHKLAEYLLKHRHSSPFEQVQIWLEMKLPIFVARQFCLSGDTDLHFENGHNGEYRRTKTIAEAYQQFIGGGRQKQQLCRRKLRKFDIKNGTKSTTNIVDMWKVGEKLVYKLDVETPVTADTFSIKITDDHKVYTNWGWKTIKDFKESPESYSICTIGRNAVSDYKQNSCYKKNSIEPLTECWVPLFGWEGYYEISSQGRVRNISKNAKLSCSVKKNVIRNVRGYKRSVTTCFAPDRKAKQLVIARAMLQSFVGDQPGKCARHLNGNSLWNTLDNLAWGTPKENTQDSIDHSSNVRPSTEPTFNKIKSIKYIGVETVYDLSVADDDQNFVAGGIVVHNCRHRTVRLNEISGRYITLPSEWYIPDVVRGKAATNKQGSEDNLMQTVQDYFKEELNNRCQDSYNDYTKFLEFGVAPEQARMMLHLNHYTHWLWNQDLHNIMHFLSLRAESHSQWEAQQYALAIIKLLEQHLPKSMELFNKYKLN